MSDLLHPWLELVALRGPYSFQPAGEGELFINSFQLRKFLLMESEWRERARVLKGLFFASRGQAVNTLPCSRLSRKREKIELENFQGIFAKQCWESTEVDG